MDELENSVKNLIRPRHNNWHDGKLGCWSCTEDDAYNQAIDDVLNLIKKEKYAQDNKKEQ
jgi:hypothetical protein